MVLNVIGVRHIDFADKNDASKRVKGVSVFCARPIPEDEGEGFYFNTAKGKEDKYFFSEWVLINRMAGVIPSVGDLIDITFTRDGKIENARILDPVKDK